jgi:hypothetical protein
VGTAAAGAVSAALWEPALSAPSAARDIDILNFFLLLEQTQAALYAQAVMSGNLNGGLLTFAEVARDHEREHVTLLRDALGREAREEPTFDLERATRGQEEFATAARQLEDLTLGAYNGLGPSLTQAHLLDAMRIVSVEARHVAWIRDLVGEHPAPVAADTGMSRRQVLIELSKTGLVRTHAG